MKYPIKFWLSILLWITSLVALPGLQAQLTWSNNVNGTWNWFVDDYWTGGTPVNPESKSVSFAHGARIMTVLINLPDGVDTLTLQNGMSVLGSSVAPGLLTLNMQGKTLVFDGGELVMYTSGGDSDHNLWAFSNGTVQIGTAENASSIRLALDHTEHSPNNFNWSNMIFNTGATLDTFNTKEILIVAGVFASSKRHQLDLTNAALRSGEREDVLAVNEDIRIGQNTRTSVTNTRQMDGVLKLGVVREIEVGSDLVIGERGLSSGQADGDVSGHLEVAHNSDWSIALNIGRDLRIGTGDRAVGSITGHANQAWDVKVGDAILPEEERGVIYIGYKNQNGNKNVAGTSGAFVAGGGTFSAYVREIVIGRNILLLGSATGVLDFSLSTVGEVIVEENVYVGHGVGAQGTLKLAGGIVRSESLIVGESTGLERSIVDLSGTIWTIRDELRIGELGDVRVTVGPASSGFDILTDLSSKLVIEEGGKLEFVFDYNAGEQLIWGLRILGDHQEYLADLISEGKLLASGVFTDFVSIIHDGTYTYYGVAVIPESGSYAFVFAVVIFGFMLVRTRRLYCRRAGSGWIG